MKRRPDPEELRKLRERIDIGVKTAIANAIEKHRQAGNPIAVWQDGKVVIIPADEIEPLSERQAGNGS